MPHSRYKEILTNLLYIRDCPSRRFFCFYTYICTMKKLIVIDACVREGDSRTRRIAAPVIEALSKRYDIETIRLTEMEMAAVTPEIYADRGRGIVPQWASEAARKIANADRILIAAPFWDMSFPSALKVFIENVSLFDITFTDNGSTCVGLCHCEKVLYITTRGMNIPTGDPREQATPYLKALSTLWNIGEIITVARWNMDYSTPEEIEQKVGSAIEEGLKIVETF